MGRVDVMVQGPDEVKIAIKTYSWDEARAELEAGMRPEILQRLSAALGGLTAEGFSLLGPGMSIAAALIHGYDDAEIVRMVRAYSAQGTADGRARVTRSIWHQLSAEYPGQPEKRDPLETLKKAGVPTADIERGKAIRRSAELGHDMVPRSEPEEGAQAVLMCSRCEYDLDICAMLTCDTPGVMRPKVDQLQARADKEWTAGG